MCRYEQENIYKSLNHALQHAVEAGKEMATEEGVIDASKWKLAYIKSYKFDFGKDDPDTSAELFLAFPALLSLLSGQVCGHVPVMDGGLAMFAS